VGVKEAQRGDLVTVSLPGAYGKPRPALVIQSDLLAELDSVMLCPITSELKNAAFRVTLEPNPANGLRALSQVMTDKISTLPRAKVSAPFGRIDDERMKAVERALLLAIGVV
jgi:mRNA interferase MazF